MPHAHADLDLAGRDAAQLDAVLEQAHVELHARALREAGDSSVSDPWLSYRHGVLAWSVHMLRFARQREKVPLTAEMYMVVERVAAAAVDHRIAELIC